MEATKRTRGQSLRYALAILLFTCFTIIQSRAAVTETVHVHGPSHTDCCAACHAGHLSVVQALKIISFAPPRFTEWHRPLETAALTGEWLSTFQSTRAPPA